ncbi:MAG: transposase domain-containing protein [Parabacteroides merdae]
MLHIIIIFSKSLSLYHTSYINYSYTTVCCVIYVTFIYHSTIACSCRLNNINSFEYFKDLLTKLIDINPNTDHETIRNLLPHKWQR